MTTIEYGVILWKMCSVGRKFLLLSYTGTYIKFDLGSVKLQIKKELRSMFQESYVDNVTSFYTLNF